MTNFDKLVINQWNKSRKKVSCRVAHESKPFSTNFMHSFRSEWEDSSCVISLLFAFILIIFSLRREENCATTLHHVFVCVPLFTAFFVLSALLIFLCASSFHLLPVDFNNARLWKEGAEGGLLKSSSVWIKPWSDWKFIVFLNNIISVQKLPVASVLLEAIHVCLVQSKWANIKMFFSDFLPLLSTNK